MRTSNALPKALQTEAADLAEIAHSFKYSELEIAHSFKYSELAGCCAEGKSLETLLYCLSVHNSQCIELMSKYFVGSM